MHKILSGRQIVTAAGSPVRLYERSQHIVDIDIRALSTNSGNIFVGSSNRNMSTTGFEQGWKLDANDILTLQDVDIYNVWIDADTAEDGVHWGATVKIIQ